MSLYCACPILSIGHDIIGSLHNASPIFLSISHKCRSTKYDIQGEPNLQNSPLSYNLRDCKKKLLKEKQKFENSQNRKILLEKVNLVILSETNEITES